MLLLGSQTYIYYIHFYKKKLSRFPYFSKAPHFEIKFLNQAKQIYVFNYIQPNELEINKWACNFG